MAKAKKDAAYLNVYIERTTLERLNKFCEEIGGNKSVTTDKAINRYIDEMENTPKGSFYVEYWKTDLEKLKHYRWVRNKISHDPDYSEENLCNSEDEEWIDSFRQIQL